MTTNSVLKAGVFAASLLAVASSQAVIISSSDSNALQTTEIAQALTLDKFDTSLGTLSTATLILDAITLSDLELTNTSAQDQSFNYTAGLNFLFTSGSGLGIPGSDASFDPTFAVELFNETVVGLGPSGAATFGPVSPTGQLVLDVTAFIGDLGMAGGGTFGIGCETSNFSTFSGGGGNITNVQNTQAGCSATIAYDFEPTVTTVPEPVTLGLFALGLLGMRRIASR